MKLPYLTSDLPGVSGVLKQVPGDFYVEEIPAYAPCGSGEHLFLWIEKEDLAAEDLVRHLSRTLGIARDTLGVAGMKDKRAVTRQFVSVPASCLEKIEAAGSEAVRILSAVRHTNKLKTGHLRGNRFEILLRTACPEAAETAGRIVERLRDFGVPNYFGEQRFGRGGENATLGFQLLRGEKSVRDLPAARRKFLLRLALSAAQSELFNSALSGRLLRGELRTVRQGDVLRKTDTGGLFVAADSNAEQLRVDSGETQITGPMFGPKMTRPCDEPAARESQLLSDNGLDEEDFQRFSKLTSGARRPFLIAADDLAVQSASEGLRFTFTLPAGAYATVLLREVMKQD